MILSGITAPFGRKQASRHYPDAQGTLPIHYSPFRHWLSNKLNNPFDLHVLATPPAFVLSQDQTLQFISLNPAAETAGVLRMKMTQLTFAHATKVQIDILARYKVSGKTPFYKGESTERE